MSSVDYRVCLLSRRRCDKRMFQSMVYEWEDVVANATGGVIWELEGQPEGSLDQLWTRTKNRWRRLCGSFDDEDSQLATRPLTEDCDVFVLNLMRLHQMSIVRRVPNWRKRSHRAVCCIFEFWDSDLDRFAPQIRALGEFDAIFSTNPFNLKALESACGRPCYYLPPAVDALHFCPPTDSQNRPVDCYTMGRRDPIVHAALEKMAARGEFLYLYDTARMFEVTDCGEHRRMLARLLQRSKYTVCSKRDEADLVLPRMVEAAAAGSIMLGVPPDTSEFQEMFSWPGAFIRVDEGNAEALQDQLADLARNPAFVRQARQNGVRAALLQLDWIYRWDRVRESLGLPCHAVADHRKDLLETAAQAHSVPQGNAKRAAYSGRAIPR